MARRSETIAILDRAVRTPRGATGLAIAGAVVLVAVIGPGVAPYSTTQFVTSPFARASSNAWLGWDTATGPRTEHSETRQRETQCEVFHWETSRFRGCRRDAGRGVPEEMPHDRHCTRTWRNGV